MASPTEAEIQAMIGNAIKIINEGDKFGRVNATNFIGLEDTFIQSLESDYVGEWSAAESATRSLLSSYLGQASAMISPGLLDYAKFMAVPDRSADAIIDQLYQRFIDAAKRVTSRQFTFAAPAAGGGNIGTGSLLRLNKDRGNFDIENQFAEAKRAICVADQATGAVKHEELFELRGVNVSRDLLQLEAGSGLVKQVVSLSGRGGLLSNPSFSGFSPTAAAPTSISDWTSSIAIAGNYVIDTVNYYRDYSGDGTPASLQMNATCVLSQKLSVRNIQLDKRRPYMVQLAWNRAVGGATGTLVLKIGTRSVSVVVAAQAGWQVLRVALDTNSWPVNFEENDTAVKIDWTRTAGTLLVDEVIFTPGIEFGGGWYWLVGGPTPWMLNDVWTWTDTEVGAILQRWFWRAFNRYLPATTGGGVTWAEP